MRSRILITTCSGQIGHSQRVGDLSPARFKTRARGIQTRELNILLGVGSDAIRSPLKRQEMKGLFTCG